MDQKIDFDLLVVYLLEILFCSREAARRPQADDFRRCGGTIAVHDVPRALARPAQTTARIFAARTKASSHIH